VQITRGQGILRRGGTKKKKSIKKHGDAEWLFFHWGANQGPKRGVPETTEENRGRAGREGRWGEGNDQKQIPREGLGGAGGRQRLKGLTEKNVRQLFGHQNTGYGGAYGVALGVWDGEQPMAGGLTVEKGVTFEPTINLSCAPSKLGIKKKNDP